MIINIKVFVTLGYCYISCVFMAQLKRLYYTPRLTINNYNLLVKLPFSIMISILVNWTSTYNTW